MRLIDADTLFPYGAVPYVENDGFATADKLYGIIKNAPTIDPESLRPKGEWETYPSHAYRKCSVCKVEFDKPKFNIRANFCPNCGANMRGDS